MEPLLLRSRRRGFGPSARPNGVTAAAGRTGEEGIVGMAGFIAADAGAVGIADADVVTEAALRPSLKRRMREPLAVGGEDSRSGGEAAIGGDGALPRVGPPLKGRLPLREDGNGEAGAREPPPILFTLPPPWGDDDARPAPCSDDEVGVGSGLPLTDGPLLFELATLPTSPRQYPTPPPPIMTLLIEMLSEPAASPRNTAVTAVAVAAAASAAASACLKEREPAATEEDGEGVGSAEAGRCRCRPPTPLLPDPLLAGVAPTPPPPGEGSLRARWGLCCRMSETNSITHSLIFWWIISSRP